MVIDLLKKHIIVVPQIYVPLEPEVPTELDREPRPRQEEIPMTWTQEGDIFRLDIDLPASGVLDVYFSSRVGSLHVNGETIWEHQTTYAVNSPGMHVEVTPAGLRLTCTSGGSIHLLARCILETETEYS
jgi:hypothetical protein